MWPRKYLDKIYAETNNKGNEERAARKLPDRKNKFANFEDFENYHNNIHKRYAKHRKPRNDLRKHMEDWRNRDSQDDDDEYAYEERLKDNPVFQRLIKRFPSTRGLTVPFRRTSSASSSRQPGDNIRIPRNSSIIRLQDFEMHCKTPDVNEVFVLRTRLSRRRLRKLKDKCKHSTPSLPEDGILKGKFPFGLPLPAIGMKQMGLEDIAEEDTQKSTT